MNQVFVEENTQVSVFTPLDAMFAEYRRDRANIERISAFVQNESNALGHFLSGAMTEHNYGSMSAQTLFEPEPAIRSLDAEYWSRAMQLTDVLEYMDAKNRNEWNEQIYKHKTPAFEQASVIDTIRSLLAQRNQFLAERVDGLFRKLSGEHVTNSPAAFGKRMIIDYIMIGSNGFHYVNNGIAEYIHDLRCIIAKFSGRDVPKSRITCGDIDRIVTAKQFGEWHEFDGRSWKIKIFKKGTAHMEIHPDMAWRLNAILASIYPMAIPESFRRKPVKEARVKEFEMLHDLVSFPVIEEIRAGRVNNEGTSIYFSDQIGKAAGEVLGRLGGIQNGLKDWLFNYNVEQTLNTLYRMGTLPEQKSHQFYGTPESIGYRAVEMAEIDSEHMVLEPEAGQGGLADHLPNKAMVTCVEISSLHCDILRAKGYKNVNCVDFLLWNRSHYKTNVTFDRIVMNPPFSEKRAETHLSHAAGMLNSGGILVAVLPASLKGKTLADGMSHEWSETITGEFEGTGVSVVLLKLKKE